MQILTNSNRVEFYGVVVKGIYDADPSRELYRVTNNEGVYYAVTEGFEVHEVQALPEDYKDGLYLYTPEKGFYKDENFKEPFNTEEEVIALKSQSEKQQADIDYLMLLSDGDLI